MLTRASLFASFLLLAIAVPAAGQARPSYAGTWRLDVAQSRDLPAYYQDIHEHRLDITQTDSTLTVDVTLTRHSGEADRLQFAYDLRQPVRTTTQVRTPNGTRDIPTTLTATRRPDGGVEIDIAREITMGQTVLRPRDHESWRLSDDGRTLLIDREFEMPGRGGLQAIKSSYVFVRG